MILDGETVLEDDHPVYYDYCYVGVGGKCPDDGEVLVSHLRGTVADLKRDTGAAVIRRCEIVKREKALRDEQDRYAGNR